MKKKFGTWKLKQLLKTRKRKRKVHNLDTAKSIGILFDASELKHFNLVQKLYNSLKYPGNDIRVLGYSKHNELLNQYLFKKDFVFFQKKNLNWYGRPVHEEVERFINRPLDLLIDLSLSDEYHFLFVVALSLAQFKVGHFTLGHNYYDMMINVTKKPQVDYLIEQAGHYLSIINKPYILVS